MSRRLNTKYLLYQLKVRKSNNSNKDNRISQRIKMLRKTNTMAIRIETEAEKTSRAMKEKSIRKRERTMSTRIKTINLEKLLKKLKNKHNNKILYYF
jgi:hypothetical protein